MRFLCRSVSEQRQSVRGLSCVASPSIKIKVYWLPPFLWFLQQQLAQLQKEKSEILKNLALYYFTFVDVMEFKVGAVWCELTSEWASGRERRSRVMKAVVFAGPCLWAAEYHWCLPGLLWYRKLINHCKHLHYNTVTIMLNKAYLMLNKAYLMLIKPSLSHVK